MIYSRIKVSSLLLFLASFYILYGYNIQFHITMSSDFSHLEMSHGLFITSQKLLFNMTIFTGFLLVGFRHRYHHIFTLIRMEDGPKLVSSVLIKNGLLSALIALQAIFIQVIFLAWNGLGIDLQVLALTFLVVLMYIYSNCSLYTVLYYFTIHHIKSLSALICLRLMLLGFLFTFVHAGYDFQLDALLYVYILTEVLITNILILYLFRNKERFAL